jgi:hypothetical protein
MDPVHAPEEAKVVADTSLLLRCMVSIWNGGKEENGRREGEEMREKQACS